MKSKLIIFSIGSFFILQSATFFPPDLKWKTVETRYFYIHFHNGVEEKTLYIKNICDRIYEKLSGRLNWKTRWKIHTVVAENRDDANGLATVFPRPVIYLFVRPPFPDESIANYRDYLELLFIHELTHILTLDQARGISNIPRYILGRIYFPNVFLPTLYIEGIAVFYESLLTGSGRNFFTFSKTFNRTIAGQNFSLSRSTGELSLWPDGLFPYFSGGAFLQKIAEEYGEKKISEFFNRYSGRIPFFINGAFNKTFRRNSVELWKDFLNTFNTPQTYPSSTHRKFLTENGYLKKKLIFDPQTNTLYFYSYTGKDFPGIYSLSTDKGRVSRRWDILNAESISLFSPDSKKIYATGVERKESFYLRYYVYRIKANGGIKRIKETEGIETIAWVPASGRFVGTRRVGGKTEVTIFRNEEDRFIEEDKFFVDDVYLTDPSPSQRSYEIAYTCKRKDSDYDICTLDLERRTINFITLDKSMERFPKWRGDRIYFTSDRDGQFYLYSYSIPEREFFLEYKDERGVYEFDIGLTTSTLFYISYSGRGFDIYSGRLTSYPKKITFTREEYIVPFESRKKLEGEKYSPLSSILPMFWVPYMTYTPSTGFFISANTFNQDVLGYFSYFLSAGFHSLPSASFYANFQVDRFYPTLGIIGEREAPGLWEYQYGGENKKFWFTENRLALYASVPFLKTRYRISADLFFENIWEEDISHLPEIVSSFVPVYRGYTGRIGLRFTYDSRKKYNLSIVQEDGTKFVISSVLFSHSIQNPKSSNYWGMFFEIQRPLRIPLINVVITPILKGAWADGKGSKTLFTAGGWSEDTSFFPTQFSVRGNYSSTQISGKIIGAGSVMISVPAIFLDKGISSTFPLFLRDLYFDLFYDFAGTYKNKDKLDFIDSVGISLNLDTYIGYHLPLKLKVSLAYSLGNGKFDYRLFSYFFTFNFDLKRKVKDYRESSVYELIE